MITEVYVDGYRSLCKLEVPLERGLNILVGPNGGGKTNILSFFEFLSLLLEKPLDEAVSTHGGIGRVFTRSEDDQFVDTLTCRVRGSLLFRGRTNRPKTLWYTWECTIKTTEGFDEIFYENQTLYIDLRGERKDYQSSDMVLGIREQDGFGFLNVKNMVATRVQPLFHTFRFLNLEGYLPSKEARRYILLYTRGSDLKKNSILAAFPPQLAVFSAIASDISGGKIYNFVPEVCKQPEDSSRPPFIEKNGAGLASTLYHIGRPTRRTPQFPYALRGAAQVLPPKTNLRKISSYVSLVSDSVKGVSTKKNPIDNTISVFLTIEDGADGIQFPLAECSDGTVKWLALITTLLTSRTGFSIEEPENFLHPNIQKEFLNVVRTEHSSTNRKLYTLVTTHSESLLNEASPNELILVWMENGTTKAERIHNYSAVVEEINRTGFGLGYYYSAGSLQNA